MSDKKKNKAEEETVKIDLDENSDKENAVEEEPIQILSEEENELAKKADEFKELAQRIQAEFDNYRKRNNESVRIARSDGINDVIIALLPVLDNFERAIPAINEESAKAGVELIYKQTLALLTKFDVEEIASLGEEFDPKFHHAIAQCEDAENANKIVEVYQKGYKRKDKVLRPSLVKVAQ